MKDLLIDPTKAADLAKLKAALEKSGLSLSGDLAADAKTQRTAGVTWRGVTATLADSQQLAFRIKQSGDIYAVLLNGKQLALREQDSSGATFKELAGIVKAAAMPFQKRLARVKTQVEKRVLPGGFVTQVATLKALRARVGDKRALLARGEDELRGLLDGRAA